MTIMNTTGSEHRGSLGHAISVPPETRNYHGDARGGGGGGGDTSICPVEISIQGLGEEPKTEVAFLDKLDVGGPRLLVSLQSILALKHNGMKLKGMLDQTSTALGKCRQGYFKELLYLREKLRRQKKEAEEGGGFSPGSPHGRSTTDHSTVDMPGDPAANDDDRLVLDDDEVYLFNCPDLIMEPGLKESVMRFYKEMTRKLRLEITELRLQGGSNVSTGLPSRVVQILSDYRWENVISTCFEKISRTNKDRLNKYLETYLIENADRYEPTKSKDEVLRDLENKLREANAEMSEKRETWEEKSKEAADALRTALQEKASWEKKFWQEAKRVEALEEKEANNDLQTEVERLKKIVADISAQAADTEERLADATKKHAEAEERLAALERDRDQSAEERLMAEGERHAAAEGRKAAAGEKATLAEENLAAALERICALENELSDAEARAAAVEEARPAVEEARPAVEEARSAVEEARSPNLPVEKELNDLGTKSNDLEIESNVLETEHKNWISDRTAEEEKWKLAREEEEKAWREAREKEEEAWRDARKQEEEAWLADRGRWEEGWQSARVEAMENEEELCKKNDEASPGSAGRISSHRSLAWEDEKSVLMDQINLLEEESEKKIEIIQTFEGYLKEANDAMINCFNSYIGYVDSSDSEVLTTPKAEDSREEPVEESGDGDHAAAGSSQKLESEGLKLKSIINQLMQQRLAAEAESTSTDLATLSIEAMDTFIRDAGRNRVQEAIAMFGAVYDYDESTSETKLQTSNGEKYMTSIRAFSFIMMDMVRAANKARKIAAIDAENKPIPEERQAGKTKEPTPDPTELDEDETGVDIPEPAAPEGDDKIAATSEAHMAAAEAEAARARVGEADEKMDAAMALMALAEAEAAGARARMDEAAEKMAAAEALMAAAEAKAVLVAEDHADDDKSLAAHGSSGGADFDALAAAQAQAAAAEDRAAECGRRAEDLCADINNLRLQMGEMEATNLEALVQLKEKYEREMKAKMEEASRTQNSQREYNKQDEDVYEDVYKQAQQAPAAREDTDPVISQALVKEKVLKLRIEELVVHIKALESKLNDAGKTVRRVKETWMDRDFQDFEVPYRIRSDALRNGMKRYHLLFHDASCATKLRNHKMEEKRRKNIMELEKNTREAFTFLKDTGFWISSPRGEEDSPCSRDSLSFFTTSPLSVSPKRSRSPVRNHQPVSPRHERCFQPSRTGVATAPHDGRSWRHFSPRAGGGSWLSRKPPAYLSSTHVQRTSECSMGDSVNHERSTLSTEEFIVQWDEKMDPEDPNSTKWDKHMTRLRRGHQSSRSPRRLYHSSKGQTKHNHSTDKYSSTAPESFYESQCELSGSQRRKNGKEHTTTKARGGDEGYRALREIIAADTEGLGRPHHASFACFDGRPNTESRPSRRAKTGRGVTLDEGRTDRGARRPGAVRRNTSSSRSASCMSDPKRTEESVRAGKKSRSVSREANTQTKDSEEVYEQLSAAAMEEHKPSSPTCKRLSPMSTAASTLVSPHTFSTLSGAGKLQGGGTSTTTSKLMIPPDIFEYGTTTTMQNIVSSPMGSTLKLVNRAGKSKDSSRTRSGMLQKTLEKPYTSMDATTISISSPTLDGMSMLPPLTTCGASTFSATSQMKKNKSMTSVTSSSWRGGGGGTNTTPRGALGATMPPTANLRQLDTRALFTRKHGRSNERPKLVIDSIGGHSFGAARSMFGDFSVDSSTMGSLNYISYGGIAYNSSYLSTTSNNNKPQGTRASPRGNGKSGNNSNNRTGDDDSRPPPLAEQMHASTLNNTSWLPKKKNLLISPPSLGSTKNCDDVTKKTSSKLTSTLGDWGGRAFYEKSVTSRATGREASNNRSRAAEVGGGDRDQAHTSKEKSRIHKQAEQKASTVSNLRKELSASSFPLVYPKPER